MAESRWHPGAAAAIVSLVCLAAVARGQSPAAPALSIPIALDWYAQGEHSRAFDAKPFDGHDVVTAIDALNRWTAGDPGKGQVAVRFVVDMIAQRPLTRVLYGVRIGDGSPLPDTFRLPVRASTPSFLDERFTAPLVAWACPRMPQAGLPEPWEAWWWLTSIALLQGSGEWGVLLGNQRISYGGSAPPDWQLAVRKELDKSHLAEAHRRLGPLPRLRLAEAVARTAALTDATKRFRIGAGSDVSHAAGRFDVIRVLEDAARGINTGRFTERQRDFERLLTEQDFEGEVSLRIAQLRLLRRDWNEATQWLDRAARTTSDPIYLAAIDYFRGWIFERTERHPEALAAYRAAHARYGRSPSLNTLLAAQLMRNGERAEAARIVEATIDLEFDHHWQDLWTLLLEGDARRAPLYAQRMREAK
jgi:hypothetical protein